MKVIVWTHDYVQVKYMTTKVLTLLIQLALYSIFTPPDL